MLKNIFIFFNRADVLKKLSIINLALTLTILAYITYEVNLEKEAEINKIVSESLRMAENELSSVFNPVINDLLIAKTWGESGLLNINDIAKLNNLFIPLFQRNSTIHSIHITEERKTVYLLKKEPVGWITGWSSKKPSSTLNLRKWESWENAEREWSVKNFSNKPYTEPHQSLLENSTTDSISWSPVFKDSLWTTKIFSGSIMWQDKQKSYILCFNLYADSTIKRFRYIPFPEGLEVFLIQKNHTIRHLPTRGSSAVKNRKQQTDSSLVQDIFSLRYHSKDTLKTIVEMSHKNSIRLIQLRDLEKFDGMVSVGIIGDKQVLRGNLSIAGFQRTLAYIILLMGTLLSLLFYIIYRYKLNKSIYLNPDYNSLVHALPELIKKGEHERLEFKSSLRWDYRLEEKNTKLEQVILKTISALANSKGGMLLIGVSDECKVIGLENDYKTLKKPDSDYFELHLRNLLNGLFGIRFSSKKVAIYFPVIEGKEICSISVRKSAEPLFLELTTKSGKSEKFYVRSGNSSREIEKPSEIASYVLKEYKSA